MIMKTNLLFGALILLTGIGYFNLTSCKSCSKDDIITEVEKDSLLFEGKFVPVVVDSINKDTIQLSLDIENGGDGYATIIDSSIKSKNINLGDTVFVNIAYKDSVFYIKNLRKAVKDENGNSIIICQDGCRIPNHTPYHYAGKFITINGAAPSQIGYLPTYWQDVDGNLINHTGSYYIPDSLVNKHNLLSGTQKTFKVFVDTSHINNYHVIYKLGIYVPTIPGQLFQYSNSIHTHPNN